ncbi:MAG TPA: carboxypeptidase M32 [Gemmatimonadetes bacterium]|nr:carboxypeptidase M32 [Gemmatimonadota bacterium]
MRSGNRSRQWEGPLDHRASVENVSLTGPDHPRTFSRFAKGLCVPSPQESVYGRDPEPPPVTPYEELEARFRELSHLAHAAYMLHWDEACVMPPGGGEARGESMALLAAISHQRLTHPEIGALLDQAEGSNGQLDSWQRANVRAMRRTQRRATAVPESLVRAKRIACTRCEQTWRVARGNGDWPAVSGLLEEVVRLTIEEADALGESLSLSPYDALLDGYEPDTRSARVAEVFDDLKTFLPELLERVLEHQKTPLPVPGPVSAERQHALGEVMMRALGFDFDRGRLDVSHHPFCGGVPDDTRITTRYNEENVLDSLMAVLHETGHALYQQGLPTDWRHQPVGSELGMAVHESQSLFVEMQVARGREFMKFAAPIIREQFSVDGDDPAWSAENLHAHVIQVQRSHLRVGADEITYPLHIILRFELEQALIAGDLAVGDIPDAWDDAMTRHLGLSTRDNLEDGCMQDVHWFAGLFGYFPSYSLGALTAAQLFDAASRANPDLGQQIEAGEFRSLIEWLRREIHSRGQLLNAEDLLMEVTGERLDARFFKAHLERRYLAD